MIELDTNETYGAKIRVVGVGGGGGNAVNNMIKRQLTGVDFIVANTDVQALQKNLAPTKIQIGKQLTKGLGAGAKPEVGQAAMEESLEEIKQALAGSDMIFVTAGMGGGTGTGGAPIVAKIGRELGALVVGIVTRPFQWEGSMRHKSTEYGLKELRENVDSLIVIPNQRLLAIIDKKTSFEHAFLKVDDVLYNATRGIADIISGVGYINVDFADVRTVMKDTGDAIMGTGTAKGDNRATEAAELAISSPLLEGTSIHGAQGVLVNITAGANVGMMEISEAVSVIEQATGSDVNLIQGVVIDENIGDEMIVTVVATGFSRNAKDGHIELMEPKQEPVKQPMHQATTQQPRVQQPNGGMRPPIQEPRQNGPLRPQAPVAGNKPQSHNPQGVERPTGVKNLRPYDEPAFTRRAGNGDERPAFLRRIMD